ncbi:MAG: hypothetical protein ACOX7Q_05645 [Kiritimatiellia bacterium]|jgi:hypothetical protein
MNRLKRYTVKASFGESYLIVGEADATAWLAAVMALNNRGKAVAELIRGDSETDIMAKCRDWVAKNIEKAAVITQQ